METVIIILNWIGTFLLTIEAMRISNFRKLTGKILKFRTAINPPFFHSEDGNTYIPVAPKGYKLIRKLAHIIEVIMGYLIIFALLSLIGYLHEVIHFFKTQLSNLLNGKWYLIIFKIWSALIVFILLPGLLGATITTLFTRFADRYNSLLLRLEEKIVAGTIGFVGFILLSLGFILDLIKIHYFS